MSWIKSVLRRGFEVLEHVLDAAFGVACNPMHHLGALGFLFYWVVAVSGIYLYIGFDTNVAGAYGSIEYLTKVQWYAGGVMRSLHRYGSDALVGMMMVHMAHEFAQDRLRGPRWFTWFTGVPILWFVYAAGITGYWLVWDQLAQYVALATSELFDSLPIFGESIARNFLAPDALDDRFFTLMIFLHIAIPLILLVVLWVHLQRVTFPEFNPPLGLTVGTMVMLVALSLIWPATSHAPADLAKVPGRINLDWFYFAVYPLIDRWSALGTWAVIMGATWLIAALPWLPPMRRKGVAVVTLDYCNGCTRCADDCPYNAISMVRRTDGKPFSHQAEVNEAFCVSCGICVGSCPTSSAFRSTAELPTGIDLPDPSLRMIRERIQAGATRFSAADAPRVMVFGCDPALDVTAIAGSEFNAVGVSLPCAAALPPSFIDYVLTRRLADGVLITGCGGRCKYRWGTKWMNLRLGGKRDPYLRGRVPRERLAVVWADSTEDGYLKQEIVAFSQRLAALPPLSEESVRIEKPPRTKRGKAVGPEVATPGTETAP
ncbi:Hydrogenase iron-sulfur subunit [uncultured Gammaproteobacteria bacterium]